MSFKDKIQGWINYSDEDYVNDVEQEENDDFDFQPGSEPITRPQNQTKTFRTKPSNNNVVSINSPKPTSKPSVVFQQIDRFEDVNKVADILKQKRIVVLNLENCPNDVSQRIIDVLYGVSYAGDGDFKKIAGRAYIITPNNVPVSGELGVEIMDLADNI